MQFEYPAALLLLLLVPLVLLRRRGRGGAVTFPGIREFEPARVGWRQRSMRYLPWLRVGTLALLVFAMAGPRARAPKGRRTSEGVAIEIVIDRSASMAKADMPYGGVEMRRIEVVKRISREFIFGNGHELDGRPQDLIGVIGFAADPVALAPLTLVHDALRPAIDKLQTAEGLKDDGTAIGDALAFAAEKLHALTKTPGKVIVLITDGENNLGVRTPRQAALMAKEWGIKICAISIRPDAGDVLYEQAISAEMQMLGGSTHGIARMARDTAALKAVYQEIDRMGQTQIDESEAIESEGLLVSCLLVALLLLVLEVALRETWWRKVPA
ncbi:MAG TPA: VWA domain-containing protein [Bryobacteraceae bacterium]|jgi:Ca-activated chloride channel family protein